MEQFLSILINSEISRSSYHFDVSLCVQTKQTRFCVSVNVHQVLVDAVLNRQTFGLMVS